MKARLFVLGGRDVGRSFEIADQALLGRGEDCQVRLRDLSVSRHHARILWDGTSWVLEDLGSRNGVRWRGSAVARAELADHDEIWLGELPIRFRFADASALEDPGEIVLEEEPAAASAGRAPSTLDSEHSFDERRAVRRGTSGANLLRGDLAELPPWKRALIALVVLAAALGMGWLAFRTILEVRRSL